MKKPVSVTLVTVNDKQLFMANNVQLSYPRVWEAETHGNNTFGKGLTIMFDKTDPAAMKGVEVIQAEMDRMITKDFGGRALPADKLCLKDGDAVGSKERYEGHFYLSAGKPNGKIVCFTPGGKEPMSRAEYDELPENQKIVDGCYASVKFTLWSQVATQYGSRINGEALAVRWSAVGEGLPSDSQVAVTDLMDGFDDEELESEDW